MINVSKEFKEKIKYGRFLLYLTITLADGTVLNLDDSNIWEGGFKIDEGVTESGGCSDNLFFNPYLYFL